MSAPEAAPLPLPPDGFLLQAEKSDSEAAQSDLQQPEFPFRPEQDRYPADPAFHPEQLCSPLFSVVRLQAASLPDLTGCVPPEAVFYRCYTDSSHLTAFPELHLAGSSRLRPAAWLLQAGLFPLPESPLQRQAALCRRRFPFPRLKAVFYRPRIPFCRLNTLFHRLQALSGRLQVLPPLPFYRLKAPSLHLQALFPPQSSHPHI